MYWFVKANLGISQLMGELLEFHEFLRERSPRVVCEIGTESSGHLCMLMRSLPTLATMVGVDLEIRNEEFLQRLAPDGLDLHLISGDSRRHQVFDAVQRAVSDHGIDVLFIDGDHAYPGVRADYLNYRQLVRDGGIIAFHDIVQDYATRYGHQTGSWTGNVPLFWSRLKADAETFEFVSDRDQDGYGIGALIHSAGGAVPADL
jgi:cephalosporin hydroxylase